LNGLQNLEWRVALDIWAGLEPPSTIARPRSLHALVVKLFGKLPLGKHSWLQLPGASWPASPVFYLYQVHHRGRAQAPTANPKPPTTQIATGPRQVWCWDMTYLPTQVIGQWFYLYLILDLYSRKIVGFTVETRDDSDHAAHLVKRTALAEGIHSLASKPVLHGDNGSTLKATMVLAILHWLGIKPSYSRPRVSDDNAYAETLFRTAKYRPEFPARGFESIEQARLWG